jgi:hypothetical protein
LIFVSVSKTDTQEEIARAIARNNSNR